MVWLVRYTALCPNLDLELNSIFNFWMEIYSGFPEDRKMLSFGHCPNYPSPQYRQIVQIFTDVEIPELKVSFGLKILYILNIFNLSNSVKFKLLAF